MSTASRTDRSPERLAEIVRPRIAEGKRVRRTLEPWGRLAVDRPLPFLCVYRRPAREPDAESYRLVTSEASYLTFVADRRHREGFAKLAATVAETQTERFGGFVILEIWTGEPAATEGDVSTASLRPAFKIFAPREGGLERVTDAFEAALGRIRLARRKAAVEVVEVARRWPRELPPVFPIDEARRLGCVFYGLEVSPVFQDPDSGETFPRVLNELRRKLAVATRKFFYEFARSSTTIDPAHFHVLGRRAVVKAVWEVDDLLARASDGFEFLLQLTPVNGEQAWHKFERSRYEKVPALHYRPLPVDPVVLKRALYKAPVERIEDPALTLILRQKLDEIDRQITMLQDRGSDRFLHESLQLYGGVEPELEQLARDVLARIAPRSREGKASRVVDARTFAKRARREISFLRTQKPDVKSKVVVRSDVTGLLVSRGNLLVSAHSRIPESRVEALIQHEVGTHVLTYQNGNAQRFKLLRTGLAGYDSLQEGLAVLSEYLVGGLSRPRLRLLAGRVVAAGCLIDGASFLETFRALQGHGFPNRTAFTITVRTHRSGGLTKDAVYLRGLQQILDYLGGGGDLKPLFVGKIGAGHIPFVNELMWRGVLVEPPIMPRYLSRPDSIERLERLRKGLRVTDLIEGGRR